ncbi:glucosamine-6-phosphate deaminase [Hamadaea flava]|uniref:Glucosamine-6-phosphate deaminase n=1 Tax=Hamadaea flava TaxID=1742688 RepID=A0ABV8LI47_9ACTN|nr:glucosamine-6-phosphate deaminase [Hamadaea flava]MCP2324229.1 glucosamine-6-phosphate deaminase [Hamadaea flava]
MKVFETEQAMAVAAARHTADVMRRAVAERGSGRMIVATGNSQIAFVTALAEEQVPWDRITVFHMDEYLGIEADHPASFQRWIRERVGERMRPAAVEYINGKAADADAECDRYEALLRAEPIDLTCMGIGENGHLAFNEPGAADFDDPRWVRRIKLTPESISQQVGEGHFADAQSVPHTAISLSIPALLASRTVQVVTPDARKAAAVRNTFVQEISPAYPSTILRTRDNATLLLDRAAASASDELIAELALRVS